MESELTSTTGPQGRSWAEAASSAGASIRAADQWREIRSLGRNGVQTTLPSGREVLQFASNDYLGLSAHPAVIAAAVVATEVLGTGSGASRLVVGSRPVHDELEAALAAWKHAEAALLFSSGYGANVGVLGALARLGVATGHPIGIVSDELNHASIIDGTRVARVPIAVYPHNDVAAAALAVEEHRREGRRSVIVTDSVFSMDGDVAPLTALAALAGDTGSLFVVDDAHSVFAGTSPYGSVVADTGAEIVVVGTLSKTLGSIGGFIAGPRPLIEWCRNTARPFIFSTAMPPAAAAAALAALAVVRSDEGDALVGALRRNVDRFDPAHRSAVIPVVLGDSAHAVEVSAALLERGLLVPAIRPPTVAPGTARLRIALSAAHTGGDIAALLAALADLGVDVDTRINS